MHKLNIISAIKKMTIKELRDFIYENYYRRIVFTKENSYYLMKHQKKNLVNDCSQINKKIPTLLN